MQTDSSQPNTADIRQVLLKSFRDEELTALCFDYFRDVYDVFSTGTTKEQKIQILIEHCVRRELIPNLLAAIQRSQAEQHPAGVPSVRPEAAKHARDPRQVFISHAHEDARFAHRLAEDLRKNGWRAWIAPESIRPGEKWVEAINRGLDESGVFVLVLTPKAVQSTWVKDETNVAIEYQHEGLMRFIPLEIERCIVPPLWRAYQRIPFLGRYQDGLTSLLTELGSADEKANKQILAPPLSHKPAIDRAPGRAAGKWMLNPAKVLKSLRGSRLWVGAGVLALVALVVVLVLVSQSPAASPVSPTQRPTATSTVDVTPAPSATRPTDTPVPLTLTPMNTPLRPSPTLKPTATPTPGTTRVSDKDGTVYVPAGEFPMGSIGSDKDAESDEKPQHKVYLDAFWIDRTEVTNAQYSKCVQAGACTASLSAGDSKYSADNQPVVGVGWSQAQAYCQWAGRQLPTEAQWEKAARGMDGRIYPWGDQTATCEYAVMNDGSGYGCGKGESAWPVGSKPKGASPYGALDMAGNVWEWVADWYDEKYYASSPLKNPPGPFSGQYRVLRGGSWNYGQRLVRAASRDYASPDSRDYSVGFRCVGVGPGG